MSDYWYAVFWVVIGVVWALVASQRRGDRLQKLVHHLGQKVESQDKQIRELEDEVHRLEFERDT